MYLEHWGLDRSPFAATPVRPYPTVALTEAAARADYLIAERRRLGVLLGGHGWGKTTVLETIATEQRAKGVEVASIDAVALTSRELLWRTAEGLHCGPDAADTQMRLWRRIEDRLAENRWQGRATALLVDDAEELGADSQQQLVRLARLEFDPEARWTVLVATSPDRLQRLSPPLLHLIDLRIDLAPWSINDTVGYIQTTLYDAGCLEPIFGDRAIDLVHELTHGAPRHVARLADFALLAGAAEKAPQIDGRLVEQAFAETRWVPKSLSAAG